MDKNNDNVLKYVGNDQWEVQSNGQTMKKYSTDDLRISIVYRARCFKDAAELEAYKADESVMDLDTILFKLSQDLAKRGKLDKTKSISRLDLAFKIMEEYITYPFPSIKMAVVPLNWCAIPLLLPWTDVIFARLC